jgi:hypothetical protein
MWGGVWGEVVMAAATSSIWALVVASFKIFAAFSFNWCASSRMARIWLTGPTASTYFLFSSNKYSLSKSVDALEQIV